MDKKRVVFPGDELGTSEEFMVGEGTYEKNGKLYAANIGELEFDTKSRYATVKPITSTPVILKVGDPVIGIIEDIRSSMVFVNIHKVVGEDRQISGDSQGSIHVSKISKSFVDDIRSVYWIGDIIKANVIQAKPSIQLSTEGSEFGVIKSFCKVCQTPLIRKDKDLYCEECERAWQKRAAPDYRDVEI